MPFILGVPNQKKYIVWYAQEERKRAHGHYI